MSPQSVISTTRTLQTQAQQQALNQHIQNFMRQQAQIQAQQAAAQRAIQAQQQQQQRETANAAAEALAKALDTGDKSGITWMKPATQAPQVTPQKTTAAATPVNIIQPNANLQIQPGKSLEELNKTVVFYTPQKTVEKTGNPVLDTINTNFNLDNTAISYGQAQKAIAERVKQTGNPVEQGLANAYLWNDDPKAIGSAAWYEENVGKALGGRNLNEKIETGNIIVDILGNFGRGVVMLPSNFTRMATAAGLSAVGIGRELSKGNVDIIRETVESGTANAIAGTVKYAIEDPATFAGGVAGSLALGGVVKGVPKVVSKVKTGSAGKPGSVGGGGTNTPKTSGSVVIEKPVTIGGNTVKIKTVAPDKNIQVRNTTPAGTGKTATPGQGKAIVEKTISVGGKPVTVRTVDTIKPNPTTKPTQPAITVNNKTITIKKAADTLQAPKLTKGDLKISSEHSRISQYVSRANETKRNMLIKRYGKVEGMKKAVEMGIVEVKTISKPKTSKPAGSKANSEKGRVSEAAKQTDEKVQKLIDKYGKTEGMKKAAEQGLIYKNTGRFKTAGKTTTTAKPATTPEIKVKGDTVTITEPKKAAESVKLTETKATSTQKTTLKDLYENKDKYFGKDEEYNKGLDKLYTALKRRGMLKEAIEETAFNDETGKLRVLFDSDIAYFEAKAAGKIKTPGTIVKPNTEPIKIGNTSRWRTVSKATETPKPTESKTPTTPSTGTTGRWRTVNKTTTAKATADSAKSSKITVKKDTVTVTDPKKTASSIELTETKTPPAGTNGRWRTVSKTTETPKTETTGRWRTVNKTTETPKTATRGTKGTKTTTPKTSTTETKATSTQKTTLKDLYENKDKYFGKDEEYNKGLDKLYTALKRRGMLKEAIEETAFNDETGKLRVLFDSDIAYFEAKAAGKVKTPGKITTTEKPKTTPSAERWKTVKKTTSTPANKPKSKPTREQVKISNTATEIEKKVQALVDKYGKTEGMKKAAEQGLIYQRKNTTPIRSGNVSITKPKSTTTKPKTTGGKATPGTAVKSGGQILLLKEPELMKKPTVKKTTSTPASKPVTVKPVAKPAAVKQTVKPATAKPVTKPTTVKLTATQQHVKQMMIRHIKMQPWYTSPMSKSIRQKRIMQEINWYLPKYLPGYRSTKSKTLQWYESPNQKVGDTVKNALLTEFAVGTAITTGKATADATTYKPTTTTTTTTKPGTTTTDKPTTTTTDTITIPDTTTTTTEGLKLMVNPAVKPATITVPKQETKPTNRQKPKTRTKPVVIPRRKTKKRLVKQDEEWKKKKSKKAPKKGKNAVRLETVNQFGWLGFDPRPPAKPKLLKLQ